MDFFLLFPKYKDLIYLIIITSFLGFEIISHVPMILISPMNSAMNSIHGLIVIGGIYVVGKAKEDDVTVLILGFISIILGIINLVGGSLYTDRMLKVYKSKDKSEE